MITSFLNTLYIQEEDSYLSLDHETVSVKRGEQKLLTIPLHHLSSIVIIGRSIVSSPLLARCAKDGRNVSYLDNEGNFLYRINGPVSGNILLRKAQFAWIEDQLASKNLVRAFVAGKIYNSRHILQRLYRDSKDPVQKEQLKRAIRQMKTDLNHLATDDYSIDSIRGIEGMNAKRYFELFPLWLKSKGKFFAFQGRNRRPARDAVNSVLSFLYRLLLNDCIGAIQAVGLDPQAGFLHTLRPGRPSLGLDLMEEFRPILADRLAVSMINRQQLSEKDFIEQPGGAVLLNKEGRSKVITEYQKKKKEELTHPATNRKIPYAVLPHLQAQILARAIRNDYVEYQPYFHGAKG